MLVLYHQVGTVSSDASHNGKDMREKWRGSGCRTCSGCAAVLDSRLDGNDRQGYSRMLPWFGASLRFLLPWPHQWGSEGWKL